MGRERERKGESRANDTNLNMTHSLSPRETTLINKWVWLFIISSILLFVCACVCASLRKERSQYASHRILQNKRL